MASIISNSESETRALGMAWGRAAGRGWLIGLDGDLGVGKTHLVKGIAAGLGIESPVTSPTFTLLNELEGGRLPLCHLDLYRLEGADAVREAGLEDYLFDESGVVVVEWVGRFWAGENQPDPGALARPGGVFRWAKITVAEDGSRQIDYEDFSH